MKILLVAATSLELDPLLSHFQINQSTVNIQGNSVSVLITGVGMTATAFALGKALSSESYDLAINIGVAGAFDRSLKIAEVVLVNLECFAELGAEDGDNFISIDQLELGKSSIKPAQLYNHALLASIKIVKAITVNKAHGNDESIYRTVTRLNPQVESMEGAAFFYACNQVSLACLQIRAISNYVERRNRENWNIPLAIKNVNEVAIDLLKNL